jgi:hypothetical protein
MLMGDLFVCLFVCFVFQSNVAMYMSMCVLSVRE